MPTYHSHIHTHTLIYWHPHLPILESFTWIIFFGVNVQVFVYCIYMNHKRVLIHTQYENSNSRKTCYNTTTNTFYSHSNLNCDWFQIGNNFVMIWLEKLKRFIVWKNTYVWFFTFHILMINEWFLLKLIFQYMFTLCDDDNDYEDLCWYV